MKHDTRQMKTVASRPDLLRPNKSAERLAAPASVSEVSRKSALHVTDNADLSPLIHRSRGSVNASNDNGAYR